MTGREKARPVSQAAPPRRQCIVGVMGPAACDDATFAKSHQLGRLLAEAGYTEDNKCQLELWYMPKGMGDMETEMVAMIIQQLEATGLMEITPEAAETATFWEKTGAGELPVNLLGMVPDYVDPDFMAFLIAAHGGVILGTRFVDEEWDAKIAEAEFRVEWTHRNLLGDFETVAAVKEPTA